MPKNIMLAKSNSKISKNIVTINSFLIHMLELDNKERVNAESILFIRAERYGGG